MKVLIAGIAVLFLSSSAMAQAPQVFNYQALVRDASGNPIPNQAVSFRISILQDNPGGSVVYSETHSSTTNNFGISNLRIGNGTVVSGSFSSVIWALHSHYLKVEMDITGGVNFQEAGTSQLLSVPYALYAQNFPPGSLMGTGIPGLVAIWTGCSTLGGTPEFYWDNTNKRLGLGTSSPQQQLHMTGSLRMPNSALTGTGIVYKDDARFIHNTGTGNTFMGRWSGFPGDSKFNVGIGDSVMSAGNPGLRNTAVGYMALRSATSDNNTVIGYSAQNLPNTTGSSNTVIGAYASVTGGASNSCTLGYNTSTGISNKIRVGNSLITVIEGQVGWSSSSDRRLKKNITPVDNGIDLVKKLRPVSYSTLNDDRISLGFLAQDIGELLGPDYAIINRENDAAGTLSLRYQDLIAPLVAAVQEQQAIIEQQQQRIARLEAMIDALK